MSIITSFILPLLLVSMQLPTVLDVAHADTITVPRQHTQSIVTGTLTASVQRSHTAPLPSVPAPVAGPAIVGPAPVQQPTPSAFATSAPSQTVSNTSYAARIEQAVFDRINSVRVAYGLATLSLDTRLTSIARSHSTHMITSNFFSHTDPSGCGLSCRFDASGYSYQSIGENIYWMSGYSLSASDAATMIVDGWMNSPGHRANILNATFTHQGIGVAMVGNKIDITQDLARPR